jgi:hypothetical protein
MTEDCYKNLFSNQSKRPQDTTYKTTVRIIALKFNVQHSALHKRNGNVWNEYSLIFVQRTYTTVFKRSRDSVLSIVIRLRDRQSGVRIPAEANISLHQNALGPTQLNGCRKRFPQVGVRLPTHLHVLPTLRMGGAIPPLRQYPYVACVGNKPISPNFIVNLCFHAVFPHTATVTKDTLHTDVSSLSHGHLNMLSGTYVFSLIYP